MTPTTHLMFRFSPSAPSQDQTPGTVRDGASTAPRPDRGAIRDGPSRDCTLVYGLQQPTDIGNKRNCPMGFCPLLRNRQQLLGPGWPAWRPLCTPIPSADLVWDLVVDTCGELKDPPSSPHSGPMQAAMKHPGYVSDAAQPPRTMSRRERKSGVFCRQSRIHHVTDRA